jgi:acyl carrier protein
VIFNEILKLIQDVASEKMIELNADSLLLEDIDSITFIKIVIQLESNFCFEFDDEMLLLAAFPTVKSMIDYVESKI